MNSAAKAKLKKPARAPAKGDESDLSSSLLAKLDSDRDKKKAGGRYRGIGDSADELDEIKE